MSTVTACVVRVVAPDDRLLLDVQREAEEHGLILVTDGHELKYTLPHHNPPGHTRFALVDKNAGRVDPKEPRA